MSDFMSTTIVIVIGASDLAVRAVYRGSLAVLVLPHVKRRTSDPMARARRKNDHISDCMKQGNSTGCRSDPTTQRTQTRYFNLLWPYTATLPPDRVYVRPIDLEH